VSELKGRVPVSEAGLLTIPGIGPRLAPLLAFLFR
jgi:endonuclease III